MNIKAYVIKVQYPLTKDSYEIRYWTDWTGWAMPELTRNVYTAHWFYGEEQYLQMILGQINPSLKPIAVPVAGEIGTYISTRDKDPRLLNIIKPLECIYVIPIALTIGITELLINKIKKLYDNITSK